MATCSINNNELEIILTNDTQNTISVDSAIETYSDVLECKIQSKDIILEKVDNSVVVLELTIDGSKYVTEATLVDDENSFIKINEETLHLVRDNKSGNNVLEESVEEIEEVKVDELTKFLGEKIEDFTNQKLAEKVEEIKTFGSNTLYENLETFEEKKKDLLELVEEQFTNVVDGVKSDVNKKLDRFFKRTDLNNKTAIAIETDRLKETITEKYNSFVKELNNGKKNLEEINGEKLNQLVEDKKEEITDVIKLFVEKIYSEYKQEFNPQLKNIITENKELNEKVKQLEDIKKDLVGNKVYSEDITRAENNFKKLLKETNKKFNKVNEKLNLISKKDNTRYNSLLAAINDTDTKEYETVLNNKIEQAELGQIKEELEQSLTNSMQNEVTSLKRYIEMSAGGGSDAQQYSNGGTMNGDLHVTGTVTAGTLLSATQVDFVRETTGFSVDGDFTVDTSTFKVDSANNRVGIGTATPGAGAILGVDGNSRFSGNITLPTANKALIKENCYFKSGGVRLRKGSLSAEEISMRYESSGETNKNFVIQQISGGLNKGQIKFVPSQGVLRLDSSRVELGTAGDVVRILGNTEIGVQQTSNANMLKLTFADSRTADHGLHFKHSGTNTQIIQMGMYGDYPNADKGDFKITSKTGTTVTDMITIDNNQQSIALHRNTTITGNISATGTIKTTSDADAGSPNDDTASIRTSGGAAVERKLHVGNDATFYSDVAVTGNITASTNITTGGDLTVTGTISGQDIIKSSRINVNSGKLYVDGSGTNYSVKIGAYGQGTFFGKEGSVNGATFSLGVGSAGKIVEDMRIETFALSGAGLVNKFTNPVILVASPGANKYIVPVSIQVYKSQSGSARVSWGSLTGNAAISIGTYASSDTTGAFSQLTSLPKTTAVISGDWLYNRNQGPDTTTRIHKDRALVFRTSSDISGNGSDDVYYLKVRYMIMSEDGDFKSIANLQTKDS